MIGNLEPEKMGRIVVTLLALVGCVVAGCSGTSDDSKIKSRSADLLKPENQSVDGSKPVITSKNEGRIETGDVRKSLIGFEDTAKSSGLTVAHASAAHGQFRLVETMGGGVGLIDFNEDGRLDIFICCLLYTSDAADE